MHLPLMEPYHANGNRHSRFSDGHSARVRWICARGSIVLTGIAAVPLSMLFVGMLMSVALLVLIFPRRLVGDACCFLPDLNGYNEKTQMRLRSAMHRYDAQSISSKVWSWGLALFLVALALLIWRHKLEPKFAVMLAAYGAAVLQTIAILAIRRVPHSRVASLQTRDALAWLGLRDPVIVVFLLISLSVATVWVFLNAWPWASASLALALVCITLAFRCAASPSAISAQDPSAERIVDERVRSGRARTLLSIAVLVICVPVLGFGQASETGRVANLLVALWLIVIVVVLGRGPKSKLLPNELAELAHDIR